MEQKLTKLKGEINSSTIIVGDVSTLLSIMDRTSRQKVSKEIENLNTTRNKLNLTDLHKTLSPTVEYTFLSSVHGAFSRIDHMLGH